MDNLSAIESIFTTALEKATPEERAAYLDQACGDDPELRREVERLLAAEPNAGSFLDQPAQTAAFQPDNAALPTPRSAPEEAPGTRIGPYKLLQQLGEGGMGIVYMAEQQEPVRRLVALKLIKSGMDSGQVIARFEAERQALALMDHPNIARVLDAGTTASGRPFFVMELVKGVPITQFCDERRLSPRQRLELLIPVCHAVQHAHQKGIIHRDLKPSNVMIALFDGKPVPKVIDFGVAKATGQKLTEKTQFTNFGAIVGTLEYMSPEQAELNQLDIDTRSDIYSLGVLLYELLTGTTPLDRKKLKDGAFLEMLRLIREEEPPVPSTRLSSSEVLATLSAQRSTEPAKLARLMRGELDWIVMKALEKDRSRRYETANGFALDIQRYLADEPVQAGPPSAGYRLRKFVKRNRGPVVAAAVVFMALMAGIFGTAFGWVRSLESEQAAVKARHEAEKNERTSKFQTLRAESARHAIQIDLALRAWQQNDLIEAERVLSEVDPGFQQTWEQRYVRALCRRKGWLLTSVADTGDCLAMSADGRRIVSKTVSESVIHVSDAVTGRRQLTLIGPNGQRVSSVAISADGQHLVSGYWDGTMKVWDAVTGQEKRNLKGHNGTVTSLAISANGQRIVSAGWDRVVKVWDMATGREQHTLGEKNNLAVEKVAISADGQRIVVAQFTKMTLWDATTGQVQLTIKSREIDVIKKQEPEMVVCVAMSADGQRIVSGYGDGTVKVWDATTGEQLQTLKGHTQIVTNVAIGADGQRVISGSRDGTARVWDIARGQETHAVKTIRGRDVSVAASADGQRVVVGSFLATEVVVWEVGAWSATTTPEQVSFKADILRARSVGFSAGGQPICWGETSNNSLMVSDVVTGQTKVIPKVHTGNSSTKRENPAVRIGGNRVVAGIKDKTLKVWDESTGQEKCILQGHTDAVLCVAISNSGQRVVSGSGDKTVKVWNAATGEEQLTFKGHTGIVLCVAISGDGQRVVSASHFGEFKVWEANTGEELLALKGQNAALCVAISADGQQILSANEFGEIKVWDASTGQEQFILKGHRGAVYSAAISAVGKYIISGGADETIKVWDIATGQNKLTLKGHATAVISVAISPDGQRIISGGADGTVKVWEAPLPK